MCNEIFTRKSINILVIVLSTRLFPPLIRIFEIKKIEFKSFDFVPVHIIFLNPKVIILKFSTYKVFQKI